MSRNPLSIAIVIIQLVTFAYIVVSGPIVARNPILLFLENLGFLLILWAIFSMRVSKFRVTPEPAEGSTLVTMGPYRFIRHPMYAGTLLLTFSLIADLPTFERIIAGITLLAILLAKIKYEETLLEEHFTDYQTYKKRTFRLIPFVY